MSLAKITLFRPKLRSVTVPALTERLNKEQQAPQEVMHEEKRNLVHPLFCFSFNDPSADVYCHSVLGLQSSGSGSSSSSSSSSSGSAQAALRIAKVADKSNKSDRGSLQTSEVRMIWMLAFMFYFSYHGARLQYLSNNCAFWFVFFLGVVKTNQCCKKAEGKQNIHSTANIRLIRLRAQIPGSTKQGATRG
jgi:hypothetical protein